MESTGLPVGLLRRPRSSRAGPCSSRPATRSSSTPTAASRRRTRPARCSAPSVSKRCSRRSNETGTDDVLERVESAVKAFRGQREPFDDATMMVGQSRVSKTRGRSEVLRPKDLSKSWLSGPQKCWLSGPRKSLNTYAPPQQLLSEVLRLRGAECLTLVARRRRHEQRHAAHLVGGLAAPPDARGRRVRVARNCRRSCRRRCPRRSSCLSAA